jgi:hypothetical protein
MAEHLDELMEGVEGNVDREVVAEEVQQIRDAADTIDDLFSGADETIEAEKDTEIPDADEQDRDEEMDEQETLDRIYPTSLPSGICNTLPL